MIALALASILAAQLPSPAYEAPFRVGEDVMVVDAVVNDAQVTLMVDTGFSGYVILRQGIDLGKPTGTKELRDFVGKFSADTYKLNSLRLGGHKVNIDPDAQIISQPLRNISVSYNMHVDGLLGLGALRQQSFELNFQRHVIRFFPSGAHLPAARPPQGTIGSTLLPIGHSALVMPVETGNGQKLIMSLDTGNAFYATTHRDVLERTGLWTSDQKPKYMRVSGVASGAVESWSVRLKNLKIFGVAVPESIWDILERPSSAAEADGTVGFQFLKNFNITVDYESRIVWLQNFTGQVAEPAKGDVGIVAAYSPSLKRMTVLGVSPDSPAALAGVQPGDEPISLNGREFARENYIQMRHYFEGAAGSTANLAVSRQGNLVRFPLIRKVLVNEP